MLNTTIQRGLDSLNLGPSEARDDGVEITRRMAIGIMGLRVVVDRQAKVIEAAYKKYCLGDNKLGRGELDKMLREECESFEEYTPEYDWVDEVRQFLAENEELREMI